MSAQLIYLPYWYVLQDTITSKMYGGVEYSQSSKIANPSNLLNTYFTSSIKIKPLILENKNRFVIRKIKTFQSEKQARDFERKFLTKVDARNNRNWWNDHNGHPNTELQVINQKKTNNEKYKVDFPFQNTEIRKKAENKRVSSFCNPEVQKKIHDKKISPFLNVETQEKANSIRKAKMVEKYGVENNFDRPDFKQRNKEKMNNLRNREIVSALRDLAKRKRVKLGSGWGLRPDNWILDKINELNKLPDWVSRKGKNPNSWGNRKKNYCEKC